jgi:hypothetical protein
LLSSKDVIQKNEENMKVVENILICKLVSVHFWYIIHSKELYGICKERFKDSMSSKVRVFYGSGYETSTILMALHNDQNISQKVREKIKDIHEFQEWT